MSLIEKYFPPWSEQQKRVDKEREEAQRAVGVAAEFVRHEGFKDLQEWVEQQLLNSEVRSSDHGSMLTQVGVREGLRLVQSRLIELKKVAKGEGYV